MPIKKGQRFYHARVLDTMLFDGKSPQLYEITAFSRGMVYYKPVIDYGNGHIELGKSECCLKEHFDRINLGPNPIPLHA